MEKLAGEGMPAYSDIASMILQAGEGEYRKTGSMEFGEPLSEEELGRLGCSKEDNINDLVYAGAFVRMKDRDTGRKSGISARQTCLR